MANRPRQTNRKRRKVHRLSGNRLNLFVKILATIWIVAGISVTIIAYSISDPTLVFQGITTVACSVGVLRNKKLAAQMMIGLIVWSSLMHFARLLDQGFNLRTLMQTIIPFAYLILLAIWIKNHPSNIKPLPSAQKRK